MFFDHNTNECFGVSPYVPPCATCGGRNLFPDYDGVFGAAVDAFGRPWGCRDCSLAAGASLSSAPRAEQRQRWEAGPLERT